MPARVTLTAEEARRLGIRAPGRSKYGAKRTVVDGHSFDSKKEAARYSDLVALKCGGVVDYFVVQPKFLLEGGRWRADFLVVWADGRVTVEDCKGMMTAEHKRIVKMVQARYPKLKIVYV